MEYNEHKAVCVCSYLYVDRYRCNLTGFLKCPHSNFRTATFVSPSKSSKQQSPAAAAG